MTTAELHLAVARATGEDISTIEAMGFSVMDDAPPSENDVPGQMVDWDELPTAA
jgi:hypothetical protein